MSTSEEAPAPIIRRAKKAGSWYEGVPEVLEKQLDTWLRRAGSSHFGPARAIISPHAGYQHCGSCAAYAYREISPETERFFILGPSHRVRLDGVALSPATIYETPLGNLTIDQKIYDELKETKAFEIMSLHTDEEEHSLELQLPYLAKVMKKRAQPYTIVPMMVGSIRPEKEAIFGRILAKYFLDPKNCFIISSDFCHWGRRFDYCFYEEAWGKIYQSIERLDKTAMNSIKDLKHESFTSYLKVFGNTICGRHPIGVMLAAIEHINKQSFEDPSKPRFNIRFLHYSQSSRCRNMNDSSVSYTAASIKQVSTQYELRHEDDIVDI